MAKTNSYKKVIAGTMTAAMVAGVVSPVAAAGKTFPDVPADHWGIDSINYLAEKGAVTGNDKGMFEPGKELTRAEAATMMAQILNLPIDKDAKPSFGDSQGQWYTPFIAAVEKAGVVKGKGDGKFDPSGKIDRVSMASLLVEAYKLDTKVNGPLETKFDDLKDSWGKDKANILVKLGISVGTGDKWEPNKSVTKAEAAQFIAMTDKQFGQKEEAKVESVKVLNSKEVEVKFATEINKDAVTKEVFSLTNKTVEKVEVGKDNKTVIVTFNNIAKVEDAVLVVNPVETKADAKVKTAKYTQVISYKDTVRPEVKGVEYVDANTAKVVFSEPVADKGQVTVNNDKAVVKGLSEDQKSLVVDLTNVDENAEVVVTIVGATDVAGNLISPNPVKTTIKKQAIDKTKPVVNSVEVLSDTQLKVTFSKEFTTLDETAVTVNDKAPTSVELDKDNKKVAYVTLKDDNNLLKDGLNTIKIKAGVTDKFGIALEKEYVKQVLVSADKTAPEVTKSEVVTEKVENETKQFLVLTYSEDVDVAGAVPTTGTHVHNYVTKNNAPFSGSLDNAERKDKKVVKIDVTGATPGSWTVTLPAGFVKDDAKTPNASKAKTVTFNVADKADEAGELTYTVEANANNGVTVKFGSEVDGASAVNAANYTVEGAKVEKAVLVNNNETAQVELTLKAGSVEASGDYAVSVTGVKDKTKAVEAKLKKDEKAIVNLKENVAPKVEKAELIDGKKVVLTFSKSMDVATVDAGDFNFLLDGTNVSSLAENPISVTNVEAAENGKKITFNFSRELTSAEFTKTVTVKSAKDGFEVKDLNKNKLAPIESLTVSKIIK
ncbi:S-layer homology domain-containing protein [Bacillus paranthracis]|uniref:S-layer homology domain-containing protein n=1 Tax=Bacillus paranthracis TaxID=2026186 RepID=UPI00254CCEB3|nr:S-layer homology domain-containing protein [Bacillus paranthracis]MDK7474348.1 S-layer homology domain-containing protein [Bacillus paranthracis]